MASEVWKMTEMWKYMGSFLGLLAFLQGILPGEYRKTITRAWRAWIHRFLPHAFFVIPEFDGGNLNELYGSVKTYLSSITAKGAQYVNLCQPKNAKSITFGLANDERVFDTFNGVKVEWVHRSYERRSQAVSFGYDNNNDEKRSFSLQVHRSKKDQIVDKYIAHISAKAQELRRANRDMQLFTNSGDKKYYRRNGWESVPFQHPATFDTIAMDPELKARLVSDLNNFAAGENFYRRVGKAWKRGYLLYGPPGTGKSSMIAAIANKMRYDVYDLELTEVESNAELRKLLLYTANKSVIVIEDIDCSLDLSGQRKKQKEKPQAMVSAVPGSPEAKKDPNRVTLSGLLNFTDGLWSCCGSERIFIFTTNYVKKLDPALLRPGRMDLHINLTYCNFSSFKVLAKNYLEIDDHTLFPQVGESIVGTFVTPAEVSEILTMDKADPQIALQNLIDRLRASKLSPSPKDNDCEEDEKDTREVEKEKEASQECVKKIDVASQPPVTVTEENAKSESPTNIKTTADVVRESSSCQCHCTCAQALQPRTILWQQGM